MVNFIFDTSLDGPAFPPIVIMHPEEMQLLILVGSHVTLFKYNVTHGKQTREKKRKRLETKIQKAKVMMKEIQ